MKDGFIRLAAAAPTVKVADCGYNGTQIAKMIFEAAENGAAAIVFPELAITGVTCGDLVRERALMAAAQEELKKLMEETQDADILCVVGMPVPYLGKVYDCAAVFKNGELLALPAKKNVTDRAFSPAKGCETIDFCGFTVPMGENIVMVCDSDPDFSIGVEISEDMWAVDAPAANLCKAGATVILNTAGTSEIIGQADYRKLIASAFSGRTISAYVYANSGFGESTTDFIYSGHRFICENSTVVSEGELFTNGITYGDVDVEKLMQERRRDSSWSEDFSGEITYVPFGYDYDTFENFEIDRFIDPHPFTPADPAVLAVRCRTILDMQANGLAKRLAHIGTKTAVLGLSGGLDSTLALLVTVKAFDSIGLDRKGIKTYSMPCFGTTSRTKSNAQTLAEALGVSFKEIPILKAVQQHFEDIGHDMETLDVTYENSQARERTQLIMDIANMENGIVIGTGDLSELALGWATYNGDHMSMYAVNGAIPKTLVRHLVKYTADTTPEIKEVLYDILDTPVSPELLPPKDGEISQKTEDLVGPYELHDFFIFNVLRYSFAPEKIYHMALKAFDGVYDRETIKKWLRIFYRRFFTQQFKRSCLPDGPKIGSVGVSPRGDLRMPSDASFKVWLDAVDKL